jgi:PAS domain S-box-containing protein
MDSKASSHILVVDDDADTRANLCDILAMDGYEVETAGSATEALVRLRASSFPVILLDRRLPDATAEDILPALRKAAPDAAVLIVTGYGDLKGAIEALRLGIADYILKPIDPQALRHSLSQIMDRQRLKAAKERSEAAFGALVEAAPCLIVILRPDQTVAYFSRFAEESTGFSAAAVAGKDFAGTLLPVEDQPAFSARIKRALAGKAAATFENRVITKGGAPHWMIWNVRPLPDHEGGPAILAVGQDTTAIKDAQEKALQAERLAGIGQMVTGLAHESGNALARSRACLEMLSLEVEDRPEALNLIARIQKAQDHLEQLYEEVRNYAAPLKLDPDTWNVANIWRQAWHNLALKREGRDTKLQEHIDGVNLDCNVDQFRLEQVFRNILDNSLAACPNSVHISVHCAETSLEGRPALRVSVRDNGPGLSPEQKDRIFDPFFTTKTKGTGLGMAICRRIVDAHGGKIAVGKGEDKGAEIIITLPREIAPST